MLSRKYYRVFADLLRTSTDLEDFEQLFENYLAIENPRFSRNKFEKALSKPQ